MSVPLLTIAEAIQKADRSYLFEDYTKQALAVLQALKEQGYTVVPRRATEAMLEAGEKAILPGKMHPKDHVRWVYDAMVASGEKERPSQRAEAEKA
jgi:2-iminoacetate synthase ThiH